MTFDLSLSFHGLCAFVPLADKSMWILLPEESAPCLGKNAPQPHMAVARFHLSYIQNDAPTDSYVVLKLASCDLAILPGGMPVKQNSLAFTAFNPVTGAIDVAETDPDYLRSFYWVAPVEQASRAMNIQGGGVVRNVFLGNIAKLPQRDRKLLAARMWLNAGKAYVNNLAPRNDRAGQRTEIVDWKFSPYAGAALNDQYHQLLASEIRVDMTIDADTVTLSCIPFGKQPQNLVLKPSAAGRKVRIDIMNEESDSIAGATVIPEPIVLHSPRVQDRIFESFYNFTVVPVPATQRAIPLAHDYYYPVSGNGLMGSPTMVFPPCSPARLNYAVSSLATSRGAHAISSKESVREPGERKVSASLLREFLLMSGHLTATEEELASGSPRSAVHKALRRYQRRSGLKVTGELDEATRRSILAPQCLVADGPALCCLESHTLGYRWGNPPRSFDGSPQEAFDQVRKAMDIWQAVGSLGGGRIVFREAAPQETADFEVGWADLPGTGGVDVIAFADLPGNCSETTEGPRPLHFGQNESWDIGGGTGSFDVLSVALHELGHILGLQHSNQPGAVMYRTFLQPHDDLTDDDTSALRILCDDCVSRLPEEIEEDLD
jgi:matrixin/putative peptidoglycan binding protein